MSYDVYMAVDTGGAEPHYIEPYFDDQHPALGSDGAAGNATGRTIVRPARDGQARYEGPMPVETDRLRLRDLEGKSGADLAPFLATAVEWGIAHLDELREDNPENGWGNAEGAVTFLWDIQRMCEQHPRATLAISS